MGLRANLRKIYEMGAVMANGMSSLMIGASGLKTSQTALNTTAHNLANINTKGYTRQQIAFRDVQYVKLPGGYKSPVTSTYGLGVGVHEIRRIRDEFIDRAYRSENSRLGYYSSQYKAIEEIEDQFGELQGVTYQECLMNLYNSVNELSKEPASTIKRSSLIQSASAFLTRSTAVYKGLTDYQQTLNKEVENSVNKINKLGQTIYELNQQISKIESTGYEDANDYRDQRDTALDELSEYLNISYYETETGEVMVNAENVPFVTSTGPIEMKTRTTEGNSLYIPIWPAFDRDVYPESTINKVTDNHDKGALKGLLLARGSVLVDYNDVPVKPIQSDYDLATDAGKLAYQNDYAEYLDKQEYYNKYIDPSAILTAISGLDKLVNGIVTAINDVLCPEKEMVLNAPLMNNGVEVMPNTYTYSGITQEVMYDVHGNEVKGREENGSYSYISTEKLYTDKEHTNEATVSSYNYSILDMDKTDYGSDEDKTIGEEIFSRKDTPRYIIMDDGNGGKMYVHNNQNERGYRTEYTVSILHMNPATSQDVAKIAMTNVQGKEDLARAQELLDVFDENFASINPEQYAVGSFFEYYDDFTGQYAVAGSVLEDFVSHWQVMVTGYDSQRQQIEGVSSDEELQKMIKFQQAYNASSRYVNVINEMLEHLVTTLGS